MGGEEWGGRLWLHGLHGLSDAADRRMEQLGHTALRRNCSLNEACQICAGGSQALG